MKMMKTTTERLRRSQSLMWFLFAAHGLVTPRAHAVGMNESIIGRKFTGKRRRPKAIDEQRVCAESGCDTRLTRYNRRTHCYVHAPVKYPRVRGREAPNAG